MVEADELMRKLLETLNEAQARWYVAREANVKTKGRESPAGRDGQFRYINRLVGLSHFC